MNWYIEVLKKYVEFGGRARRTEFWMFALFNFVISAVLSFVDRIIGTDGLLAGIYGLAVLLPWLGVGVRRLHDTGRSGWWWLIAFIPCIGTIVLIVFWVQDSDPGSNNYGDNPKGAVV